MADSTDNLGQVGEDTSALIKAADADRNARIREQRLERKRELKEGQRKTGLQRVVINAPHKAQYNGESLAITIITETQPAARSLVSGLGDLNVYDVDGTLLHGGVNTLSVAIDNSHPPTKVDIAWYKDEFCVMVEGTPTTKTAFTLRSALS